jgi:hypothetical protein
MYIYGQEKEYCVSHHFFSQFGEESGQFFFIFATKNKRFVADILGWDLMRKTNLFFLAYVSLKNK